MYLSRLMLDPRSRAVRRDLADCHAMHRTVMSAFPAVRKGEEARGQLGVLYRLEIHPRTGRPTLLVQSRVEPDWSRLTLDYLWETGGDEENPAWKSVAQSFQCLEAGMVLVFRLRANPTRRIATGNAAEAERWRGKRVDLRREQDQLDWLRRKGEQSGFQLLHARASTAVPNVRAVPGQRLAGVRRSSSEEGEAGRVDRLTFGSVLFEGELVITDAPVFRRALEEGIGPGKAYGLGLLSVARALR